MRCIYGTVLPGAIGTLLRGFSARTGFATRSHLGQSRDLLARKPDPTPAGAIVATQSRCAWLWTIASLHP